MKTITYTEALVIESCYKCGIAFAMPQELQKTCNERGQSFWCPNGHEQIYAESLEQKHQREMNGIRNQLDIERGQRIVASNELSAARGQLTKTTKKLASVKKRVSNGVCPCCHRQFVNVQQHMSGMHPEYIKGE